MGRSRPHSLLGRTFPRLGAVLAFLILVLVSSPPSVAAKGFPPLPVALEGKFLTNLTAPLLTPGSSGSVSAALHDPLPAALSAVRLSVEVYAFEPFPGGASNTSLPSGGGIVVSGANLSGPTDVLVGGSVSARGTIPVTFDVVALPSAPAGAYAVRFALAFSTGGVAYGLASRGYFSPSAWANATALPGGNSTLNVSRLGVSGVLAETAVQVVGQSAGLPLYFLLGLALVLAAAGGYYACRRPPKSRSGARSPPEANSAPRAFGNNRTRDGD